MLKSFTYLADVKAFEQAVHKRGSRSDSKAQAKSTVESESEEDEDQSVPAKRKVCFSLSMGTLSFLADGIFKVNAKQSILAFLGDQSDSD